MVDEYNSGFKVKPDGTLIIELEDGSEVTIDNFTEVRQINETPEIGTEGNAWNNELTGANGESAVVDTRYTSVVDIAGVVDGPTNIEVLKSQDGTNFYFSGIRVEIDVAGDFGINDLPVGFRYIRLLSNQDVTATATIAAKM